MNPSDQYHAGIVSDDPEATMAMLTETLGYEWCDQIGGPATVSFPDRESDVEIRTWYSKSTPRLEVVQSIPGTVWAAADSGTHHLGYWDDDVTGTADMLQANGFELEAAGKLPDGSMMWAYLRPAAGPRVELVSRALQPAMEEYFASGNMPG